MNKFDVLGKTFYYVETEDGLEIMDENGYEVSDPYIATLIQEENESVEYYENMGDWF